jgi:small conductance mechanosensitive channel
VQVSNGAFPAALQNRSFLFEGGLFMEEAMKQGISLLTNYGLKVIGAILILIVGRMVANWVQKRVATLLRRSGKFDETLQGFLSNLARYAVLIATILAVLGQFGIETTSLIAVLGAASLAIGLALQGTLSNVAAGSCC